MLVYLVWLAVSDLKKRKVSMWSLLVGVVAATVIVLIEFVTGQKEIRELAFGVVPAIIMLVTAKLTQKVGYGDGIILLVIGMLYGYGTAIFLLCASIMLLALISGILLVAKKVGRNTLMPYIPFLAIAFVLHGIMYL